MEYFDSISDLFGQRLEELKADDRTREQLAQTVFFHANPSIRRVITIGTPHRGSDFANDYTRWLGRRLIRLPEWMARMKTEVTDKRQHTGELYRDREKMRALIYGALHEAKAQGANVKNAVAVGYCFGGAAVLELARAGADLKGFVTFHGGLATPEGQDYSKTKGEILIMHGTADSAISMEEFAALAKELESAGVAHEMITYGGADHAFTVFGGERYHEDADKKSWVRFIKFLESKFEK